MPQMIVIVRTSEGTRVCCFSLLFRSEQRCQVAHPKEFQSNPQGGVL